MKIEIPLSSNKDLEFKTNATLLLTGEIKQEMAVELTQTLLDIEASNIEQGVFDPIQLIINSPGGDLYSAFMLSDVMSSMITPIKTIGLGQVVSAGFLLFMSGTKGFRTSTVNTQFMTHRFYSVVEGSHASLKSQVPEFDRIHDRIVNHYKKHTGLTKKKIEECLLNEHDVWLTAEQCKEFNVCDIVIDTSHPKNKPQSLIAK